MVYSLVVHMYAKDDPTCISKLKNKLIEASQIYSKDKETVSWLVMQSEKDERAFTIVERYEQESVSDLKHPIFKSYRSYSGLTDEMKQSQQYHLGNPYWKTFDPYVLPLLVEPMDLRRYNELDTSKPVKIED